MVFRMARDSPPPSELEWDLIVTTGAFDDDNLQFAYSDKFWDSADCDVGAYNDGSRLIKCGFDCS